MDVPVNFIKRPSDGNLSARARAREMLMGRFSTVCEGWSDAAAATRILNKLDNTRARAPDSSLKAMNGMMRAWYQGANGGRVVDYVFYGNI